MFPFHAATAFRSGCASMAMQAPLPRTWSYTVFVFINSFILSFELFQTSTHTGFRESSSSLLTPGGLKSLVSISQGSLQVHRAGKRRHLIFVPAWHSLRAAQPPSSAPRRAGMEIHLQLERLGTSKGCCQSGRPKMLCVLSCLYLFAKSTLSFQYRSVLFPVTAWSEYFSRSVSMTESVTVLVRWVRKGKTKQSTHTQKRGRGWRHLRKGTALFGLAERYQKWLWEKADFWKLGKWYATHLLKCRLQILYLKEGIMYCFSLWSVINNASYNRHRP